MNTPIIACRGLKRGLSLTIALAGMSLGTLQAAIITGSVSDSFPAQINGVDHINLIASWGVVEGSYYSPTYIGVQSFDGSVNFSRTGVNQPFGWGTLTLSAATDGGGSGGISNGFSLLTTPIQHFTDSLTLGATVDASQTFNSTSVSIVGSETKYFGFAVTMPDSPSPLYGWLGLDGTGSTLGNELVTASWAYDTTGSSIQVGQIAAVPEPATWVQASLAAFAGLIFAGLRRIRKPAFSKV